MRSARIGKHPRLSKEDLRYVCYRAQACECTLYSRSEANQVCVEA